MSNVKLVSITQPELDIENPPSTPEELIVYCARVSNPSNQENHATAPGLLRYCIRNKHWSIFEMVNVCFEIRTTRAISAQIIRHRSFSFQEFSQRYAKVPTIEEVELRMQGKTNRQVGDEVVEDSDAELLVKCAQNFAAITYEKLIEIGVAKESARMILPMSSSTRLYMNGTLRSWLHYLQVRTDEHTQKEHREIALAIESILAERFPIVFEALKE